MEKIRTFKWSVHTKIEVTIPLLDNVAQMDLLGLRTLKYRLQQEREVLLKLLRDQIEEQKEKASLLREQVEWCEVLKAGLKTSEESVVATMVGEEEEQEWKVWHLRIAKNKKRYKLAGEMDKLG